MSFAMQNLIRLPSYNVCSLPCRNYDFLSFYFKSNYYRNWSTCIYQNWDIKNKWRKWEINRDIKKMKEKRDWDRINEPQMSFSDQHLSIVWFCPRYFMLKNYYLNLLTLIQTETNLCSLFLHITILAKRFIGAS